MRAVVVLTAALAAAGCGAAQRPPRPTAGAIEGLARDHDSGDPVAHADIRLRRQGQLAATATTTKDDGFYELGHLAPGRYSLTASFAGQPIDIEHIDVPAGDPTVVDIWFTLGRPVPLTVDFGNPRDGAIDRYRPPGHAADTALIEGTVSDTRTRERVAGAVVTAVRGSSPDALQTVTDDEGRYRFDEVPPGTWSVSAYYAISGRGQIEVRRAGIKVEGAQGVVVPLWVETVKL